MKTMEQELYDKIQEKQDEIDVLRLENETLKKASVFSTRNMIRNDEISIEEMEMLVDLYPMYQVGSVYQIGDIFQYESVLYVVIQAHTSQEDWLPSELPALYLAKVPVGVIPDFVQPTGSHDAYNIGDKVLYDGVVYECLIDANVWSPSDYPQGWKEI